MKDQYFGDIGDYGKFGMLRFLAQHGISIAINWYLTVKDNRNDGKYISYLNKDGYWKYDPELYRHLKEWVIVRGKREVSLLEESGLISDSKFYSDIIEDPSKYIKAERGRIRDGWHRKGLQICQGADLVFLDPDTGFRQSPKNPIKDQVKYCYANEVKDHYDSGSDVVFYTSKGRRSDERWANEKRQMMESVPDACFMALTFHKGTQRTYVFAIHHENQEKYESLLDEFLQTNWKDMFTTEDMSGKIVVSHTDKRKMKKTKSGGSTETGYINNHNQRNNGKTDKPGSGNNQWFYEMECLDCRHKYYANGHDIWLRKCPNCQGGKT